MIKVYVEAPVEYVMGYLRYGHYEGYIDMSEEEYEQFKENPMEWILSNDGKDSLDLMVDDYRVEDCGEIYEVNYQEC